MSTWSKQKLAWWTSGTSAALAVALLTAPIFLPAHRSPKARAVGVPIGVSQPSLNSIAARFELSKLPPEERPIPPPLDPAAALRAFKLIGVVEADDTAIAVISDGSRAQPLKVGDALQGFRLIAAGGRRALFVQGEAHVEFSLAEGMRSWLAQSKPAEDRPPIHDVQ